MEKTLKKTAIAQHFNILEKIIDPKRYGNARIMPGNFYDVGLLYRDQSRNIRPLSDLTRLLIIKFIGTNGKEYATPSTGVQTVLPKSKKLINFLDCIDERV